MMENEVGLSEKEASKETVPSGLSSCFSATDTQDEGELLAHILAKTPEEVRAGAPRDINPESTARTEKTGRAKRREKRLKNEPQSILSEEGPSGVHVLDFAEARATELNHMVKAMKSKGGGKRAFQSLPRHMRRRAMSHNVKRLPQRMRKKATIEMEKSSGVDVGASRKKEKPGSRKRRRKTTNLKEEYRRRQRKYAWLETHIWHAKRMKMVNKSYGYRLAEHCSDKGVRQAYRSLVHGCMLSDISYCCCTEVIGEQNRVVACLSPLFNSDAGLTIGAKAYLSGQREGKTIMYKHGTYPYGAIGPVQFLWQAPPPQKPPVSVEGSPTSAPHSGVRDTKLWIWSHPAIHEQVLSEIQNMIKVYASSQSSNKEGVSSVSVRSLKLDLVRFRLIGPRAHALLMETLKPAFDFSPETEGEEGDAPNSNDAEVQQFTVPSAPRWWDSATAVHLSTHSDTLSSCYPYVKSASTPAQFSRGAVLGMTVYDPRLFTPLKRTDMVSAFYPKPKNGLSLLPSLLNGEEESENSGASEGEGDESDADDMECDFERSNNEGVSEAGQPMSAVGESPSQNGSSSPELLPELAYSPIWDPSLRDAVSSTKISEQKLNGCRSHQFVRSSTLDLQGKANRIPVLLIQQSSSQSNEGAGWDIILPKNWAMEFWVALIFRGARACGMKELRKCSLETQSPHFPEDYPDTDAGKLHSVEQKEVLQSRYQNLPPDKRRNYGKLLISSPFSSPWSDLISKWNKDLPPKLSRILPPQIERQSEDAGDLLQPPTKRARLDVEAEAMQFERSKQLHLKQEGSECKDQVLVTSPNTFYVVRCKDILRTLTQFIDHVFAHKKQQRRMATSSSASGAVDYSDSFFLSCIKEFEIDDLLHEHAATLLPVKFQTNQRGTVCDRATISVPCVSDLRSLVTTIRSRPFSGPKEEINQKGLTVFDHNNSLCVGISSLTRRQIKEVKQIHKFRQKAKRDHEGTSVVPISPVEEFKLCPVIPSRQEFGYVTTAGLRLTTSRSSGIGFCTFAGLLETVRRCYSAPEVYELLALARGEDIQYWIIKLRLV